MTKVWLDLEFTGIDTETSEIREMAFLIGGVEKWLKIGYAIECPKCACKRVKQSLNQTFMFDSLFCKCLKCGVSWAYGNENEIRRNCADIVNSIRFVGVLGEFAPKMFPGQKTAKQAMRIFLKSLPEKLGGEGGACRKCINVDILQKIINGYCYCFVFNDYVPFSHTCNNYKGELLKWAGYNIAYDLKWIKAKMFPEYDPIWRWFDPEPLDVLDMVRKARLPISDNKLETVARYLDIPHKPHNALSDIRATRFVYRRLKNEF